MDARLRYTYLVSLVETKSKHFFTYVLIYFFTLKYSMLSGNHFCGLFNLIISKRLYKKY
jgi:hypothetical protein